MKKILIGKGLEEREATCSFCGDFNVECIKGSVPLVVEYPRLRHETFAILEIYKHFKVGFLQGNYYKVPESDERMGLVQVGSETTKKTDDADICKDCIRQLAKQI